MQKGSNQSRSPWKSILNEPLQQKKKFTALMPSLSNFIFKCKNHLQIKGCVRGTIYASSYANIFMVHFEKNSYTPLARQFPLYVSGL